MLFFVFRYRTHRMTEGLDDLGDVNWPLFGCLFAINAFCFLCIFKGVKLTGKVTHVYTYLRINFYLRRTRELSLINTCCWRADHEILMHDGGAGVH